MAPKPTTAPQPLNALILAAGFGTRLGKTGQNKAKGLFLNSDQTSITELLLKELAQIKQIKQIALITNHRFFNQYDKLISQYPEEKIVVINDGVDQPQDKLGSLGDLVFALDCLDWWESNLLILPSDRTPEQFLPKLVNLFNKQPQAAAKCAVQKPKSEIKNKFGCLTIDSQGKITDFAEKPAQPKSNLASLPFYIYPPPALALLKSYEERGGNMDSPGNFVPWLLKHNSPIYALVTKEKSYDIGSLEELAEFQNKHSSQF